MFLALATGIFTAFIAAIGVPQEAVNQTEKEASGQADDSYRYYPAHIGNTLYLKALKKTDPRKQLFVKVQVTGIEKKEDGEYFYFYGPKFNIRYLMGVDKKDGISMRLIKYPFPIFGLSVDIDIRPKMQVLRFPLTAGDKWHYEGKAKAHLLFIPIIKNLKADFEVVERVTMKTPVGDIDTYHMKLVLDSGSSEGPSTEHFWYAKNIGYSVADTAEHYAEITGFRIYDEREGRWLEKLPENPGKYE